MAFSRSLRDKLKPESNPQQITYVLVCIDDIVDIVCILKLSPFQKKRIGS